MKTLTISALVLALAAASATPAWSQAGADDPHSGALPKDLQNQENRLLAGEVAIKGKVDAVTVYRGEALVTRNVTLPAGAGLGEIVVSELPERIVPGSIFAEAAPGADGVEVRSVRYRERPIGQDVRDEVRKLDDQIRQLNDKLAGISKQQQLLQEQRAYLDKLENFSAPTANVEMTKGVLNAEQLKALTTYQFDQRKGIADQELKLQQDQRNTNEQLSLVQRQREDVTVRSSKTAREAVVFVSRKGGGTLRLRYLVEGATWTPSYNIRADAARKNATIEYQASIEQMSGEDWADVSMTLSTATPNLVATAPGLNPLAIALVSRAANSAPQSAQQFDYQAGKKDLLQYQQRAELNRNGNNVFFNAPNGPGGSPAPQAAAVANFNFDNDKALNTVAEQLQVLELLAGDGGKHEQSDHSGAVREGIVVTYEMRARTSLPSRSDQQLVQIDSLAMKSDFYKVAIPLLTSYVYDQATLVNTSKVVLLAGPAASYVGGQFVGNGALPTVAVGQPFTVGFGIDSALHATRERIDKTEQTQGGNKVINYTYRLAVDNYGTAPTTVRLLDRLPTASDSEVRVTFVDSDSVPLARDKDYQQTDRKKGILRWDVQIPAEKNGSDAFSLTYKMNMEYDRNLAISTGSVLPAQELEKLIERR